MKVKLTSVAESCLSSIARGTPGRVRSLRTDSWAGSGLRAPFCLWNLCLETMSLPPPAGGVPKPPPGGPGQWLIATRQHVAMPKPRRCAWWCHHDTQGEALAPRTLPTKMMNVVRLSSLVVIDADPGVDPPKADAERRRRAACPSLSVTGHPFPEERAVRPVFLSLRTQWHPCAPARAGHESGPLMLTLKEVSAYGNREHLRPAHDIFGKASISPQTLPDMLPIMNSTPKASGNPPYLHR